MIVFLDWCCFLLLPPPSASSIGGVVGLLLPSSVWSGRVFPPHLVWRRGRGGEEGVPSSSSFGVVLLYPSLLLGGGAFSLPQENIIQRHKQVNSIYKKNNTHRTTQKEEQNTAPPKEGWKSNTTHKGTAAPLSRGMGKLHRQKKGANTRNDSTSQMERGRQHHPQDFRENGTSPNKDGRKHHHLSYL